MKTTHRHQAVENLTEIKPFTGAVAYPENRTAHGNVCFVEYCKCGAWRATNSNAGQVERSLWKPPMDEGGDRSHFEI